MYSKAHLTEQQVEALQNYKRLLMEKKQAELQDRYRRAVQTAEDGEGCCPKRDVAPVWRLCISDSMDQSGSGASSMFIKLHILLHLCICLFHCIFEIMALVLCSLPTEPLAASCRAPVFTKGRLSI